MPGYMGRVEQYMKKSYAILQRGKRSTFMNPEQHVEVLLRNRSGRPEIELRNPNLLSAPNTFVRGIPS